MFKPISLYIGLRYTRARRSNHFISFIALVSMIGLTLGVAVLITVLSVMNGFDRELKNRVLGMIPQATVSSTQILFKTFRVASVFLSNITFPFYNLILPKRYKDTKI